MKVSQIDFNFVSQYLNLFIDEGDLALRLEIEGYISAAKSYAKEYSGLTLEQLDEKEYMTFPILVLVADMYENKSMEGYKNTNKTFSSFMSLSKEMYL
ncbi:head-tail connector protein [Cetobacterium sp.]|uniref:head-tail connector protein n=1 Tax=Cetobacterium sp. TaxID=2071632 RepID=UPI003EE4409B